ncbi:MAG: DUF3048 domain-containing protein [Oscillospiraceae bacterium]
MKKIIAITLALVLTLSMTTACGKKGNGDGTTPDAEVQEPTPTPRLYFPDPFTGWEKTNEYPDGQRALAVMVNNISACRPQRGLSDASILYESKVEGGITRFMALFQDYKKINDIGPVRSARDQFFRLILPYQPLYAHIGRSGITQTYIDDNNYGNLNLDGNDTNFIYRDKNRINQGYSVEHTAYTNAELIQAAIDKRGFDMNRDYNSPLLNFVPYDENGGVREMNGDKADSVTVVHSETYRTYFDYDAATSKYMMSQYSGTLHARHKTVDENNNQQLGFENLFIMFADITTYPYPGGNLDKNGNDKGDPNYQKVDMDNGGIAYYFSHGKVEKVRWFKGPAMERLYFTDMDENLLPINCGKSYISFVDLDEFYNFGYTAADEAPIEETIDTSKVTEKEIGE